MGSNTMTLALTKVEDQINDTYLSHDRGTKPSVKPSDTLGR